MAIDRTVRSLSNLSGSSSSRVLNLTAIGLAQANNENYRAKPLFASHVINNVIILKHKLRPDEVDLFHPPRTIATKIIIPFERTDLRVGGRSMFVGQRGYEEMLRDVGNYRGEAEWRRDLDVLRIIDSVPSLDPFLLREYLSSNDIKADASYFQISPADQQRMYAYTAAEISRLTALATGEAGSAHNSSTARMVAALLSSEVSEKLEPLRVTLGLSPGEFKEGVFSWRGFIYYKWSLDEFWPNLIRALRDIKAITPSGQVDSAQKLFFASSRSEIIQGAKHNNDAVRAIIQKYDIAYANLIERQDPKTFRAFLLSAPSLFLEIGEMIGAISHVASFWQYRFPTGRPKSIDAEELTIIFQDFAKSFSRDTAAA